jgi:Holliday junction resolvase-like predicted endonuclease
MSSYSNHRHAITAAKVYLEMRGYEITELNWHRSRSKIDIVAKHKNKVYLIWVRFSAIDDFGNNSEIPISTLLKQMYEAREIWSDENKWVDNCDLSVIEISGPDYVVMAFMNNLA